MCVERFVERLDWLGGCVWCLCLCLCRIHRSNYRKQESKSPKTQNGRAKMELGRKNKRRKRVGGSKFENTDPLFRLCTHQTPSIINHQQHPKHTPTRVRVVSSSLVDGYLSSTENAAISYHFFDERECKDYTKVQKSKAHLSPEDWQIFFIF